MTKSDQGEDRYRIGAVARLTGVPPVTLRAWERRYGAVRATRGAGRARMYSREDVERLTLIKRLVDLGNAISTVANLGLPELTRRVQLDSASMIGQAGGQGVCRTGVMGVALPARLRHGGAAAMGLELVVAADTAAAFLPAARQARPELLVLEYPTVQEATLTEIAGLIEESGASRAVVIYGFSRRAVIEALDSDTVTPLRAPVDLAELKLACWTAPAPSAPPSSARAARGPAAEATTPDPEPRRFSSAELERFARSESAIECECPRHLSELVLALAAFETYSAECVSLSPADSELHAWLHRTTGAARTLMEAALERVARQDGLL